MESGQRYLQVAAELSRVCEQADRDPHEVKLVAVSKTVGIESVASAIDAGAADFGENRPDQLIQKSDAFPQANWHFIGNIQSRRIRDIVGRATLVHSLFEERHALKINEAASGMGIVQDVLVEVNVSGEQSKGGLAPDGVRGMLDACSGLANLRVRGLMTMAPIGAGDVARQTFSGLARLRDELQRDYPDLTELSMGMTDDWRIAVEEGATIIRVGRAIFQ